MLIINLVSKVLGVLAVVLAIYFSQSEANGQLSSGSILHIPSLVFVGTILVGVSLFSYQPAFLMRILKNLFFSSLSKKEAQVKEMNRELESLTEIYYRSGAKGLREQLSGKKLNSAWEIVLNQLEAKIPASDIRELLEVDADATDSELSHEIDTLSFISSLAPSIGVLGTVVGLIRLLSELDDFSTIGPNMSLALVTTLYGIFFSIIVINPLTGRLEALRSIKEKTFKQVIFWVTMTEERKPAFYADPKYWNSQES